MKLRTHQLVCMLFLLSALRAAEGSVLTVGQAAFTGHDINFLLDQATPTTEAAPTPRRNLRRRNFLRATRIFFKATRLTSTSNNALSPTPAPTRSSRPERSAVERPAAPPRVTAFNSPAQQAAQQHAVTASGL